MLRPGTGAASRAAIFLAAPKMTLPPVFVSASSNEVTIDIVESEDANGSPIYAYEIWRDIGENLQEIDTKVEDYDGVSLRHTITGLT